MLLLSFNDSEYFIDEFEVFGGVNGIGFQLGFGNFNAVAIFYPTQLLQAFGFFKG